MREIIVDRLSRANSVVGEPVDSSDHLSDVELLDKYAMQIATYAFELGQYKDAKQAD